MTAERFVQVLALTMVLFLAFRALRSRNMPTRTIVLWAAVWIALIAAITLIGQYSGVADHFQMGANGRG